MSLETVVEDIREQARARAAEIRRDAKADAEEIREEARQEAEQIREERLAEAEREIEQEREQRLSSAKLEAKQARLEARRDVIESVREDVEAAIVNLEGEERAELTRTLLDAAAEEFDDSETIEVYGREGDRPLLKSLVDDYDGYEYAGVVDCLGGVVVESNSSRVRVKNTFDSVFEETWEGNLREVSSRLFEDDE
jgi:Archaeal/vacuolar-type H+-ATPase subunit E